MCVVCVWHCVCGVCVCRCVYVGVCVCVVCMGGYLCAKKSFVDLTVLLDPLQQTPRRGRAHSAWARLALRHCRTLPCSAHSGHPPCCLDNPSNNNKPVTRNGKKNKQMQQLVIREHETKSAYQIAMRITKPKNLCTDKWYKNHKWTVTCQKRCFPKRP